MNFYNRYLNMIYSLNVSTYTLSINIDNIVLKHLKNVY